MALEGLGQGGLKGRPWSLHLSKWIGSMLCVCAVAGSHAISLHSRCSLCIMPRPGIQHAPACMTGLLQDGCGRVHTCTSVLRGELLLLLLLLLLHVCCCVRFSSRA